jgi:hypothetical protein
MPCRCDYLEPNSREIEMSKVLALLEEFETGTLPGFYGVGTYQPVYNHTSQEGLDKATADLCSRLQQISKEDLKEKSLEMQMWWRDHQMADKKRLEEELGEAKKEEEKEKALKKLTPYEKKMLGL